MKQITKTRKAVATMANELRKLEELTTYLRRDRANTFDKYAQPYK